MSEVDEVARPSEAEVAMEVAQVAEEVDEAAKPGEEDLPSNSDIVMEVDEAAEPIEAAISIAEEVEEAARPSEAAASEDADVAQRIDESAEPSELAMPSAADVADEVDEAAMLTETAAVTEADVVEEVDEVASPTDAAMANDDDVSQEVDEATRPTETAELVEEEKTEEVDVSAEPSEAAMHDEVDMAEEVAEQARPKEAAAPSEAHVGEEDVEATMPTEANTVREADVAGEAAEVARPSEAAMPSEEEVSGEVDEAANPSQTANVSDAAAAEDVLEEAMPAAIEELAKVAELAMPSELDMAQEVAEEAAASEVPTADVAVVAMDVDVSRPSEVAAPSMPEVPMCIRCGEHPVNSRKGIRIRGLCCNKCPDHGPWCTMHSAHNCCTPSQAAGPSEAPANAGSSSSQEPPAKMPRKRAPQEPPAEMAKPVERRKRGAAAEASEKPVKARVEARASKRKRRVVEDDDETPVKKPPVEKALRRVEQEFQKRLDEESKRQHKRKQEVARELKDTQRTLKRHSLLRTSMIRRKSMMRVKQESPYVKKEENPFFAGVDDQTAAAALEAETADATVGVAEVQFSPLRSPENKVDVAQSMRQKRNRRSSLPVVLNDLKDVYAIIDDLKQEREGTSQSKQERNVEQQVKTPMKMEEPASEDKKAVATPLFAVKTKLEDDEESMGTCKSHVSPLEDPEVEEEEGESPDDKKARGRAALLKSRQLFKEMMNEGKKEKRPKRVVTPNARYMAFDDDETPRPSEKGASSASCGSSEFLMVPTEARVAVPVNLFKDADPEMPQPRSLLSNLVNRAVPVPKSMAIDKMKLQRTREMEPQVGEN